MDLKRKGNRFMAIEARSLVSPDQVFDPFDHSETPSEKKPTGRKIYLAGKISGYDWRSKVVTGLDRLRIDDFDPWPVLPAAVCGFWDYVGPYYTPFSDLADRVGYSGKPHEIGPALDELRIGRDHGLVNFNGHHNFDHRGVHQRCLTAIDTCDVFFLWIDQPDCIGSFVELGYAKARGKKIVVVHSEIDHDCWFAYLCADRIPRGFLPDDGRDRNWYGSLGEVLSPRDALERIVDSYDDAVQMAKFHGILKEGLGL